MTHTKPHTRSLRALGEAPSMLSGPGWAHVGRCPVSLCAMGAHPRPGPQPATACRVLGPGWRPPCPEDPSTPTSLVSGLQRDHTTALYCRTKGQVGVAEQGESRAGPGRSSRGRVAALLPTCYCGAPRTNPYTPGRTPSAETQGDQSPLWPGPSLQRLTALSWVAGEEAEAGRSLCQGTGFQGHYPGPCG